MTNELTDVRCPCGTEFPAESYDAGFIAGSGMCQNCDAALPPKDICTCPSGDGSLRHPCPAHPAVEQAGGDERVIGWRERILAAHPNSDPGFWTDALLVEHMAAEIADLRAALAHPSPTQAEQHWPKLEQPAKVGGVRFSAGVSSRLVVEAAQRLYKFESTPEKEAERIERLQAFREQLDPFNLAPHAEAFNEAPAEALKPEPAEAELEKQEPVGEVRESGGTLTAVIVRHSYATKPPVGTKLYAAPVSQAQRSVPEEFSFEYRHPNGECHTVTVSREQVINEMPDFLFEALCSKFCNCEPVGETNVVECCCDEYAEEFKLIASAPGKEGV
ncbi:hypothetical protein [Pseudomonas aeruginosa]|uniref:hypothetical protein n=1 Tax=Pseudomonas aeruginosa TaxID=287 RepID=UPI0015956502|nr:hypothetical protein [Pseudomonas aeruginosa]HCF0810256.1 hypothetical protein [Pseudomonas aeruginosa]